MSDKAYPDMAFPSSGYWPHAGLTMRDYFAAAALQGVLKDRENIRSLWKSAELEKMEVSEFIASRMYLIADAMLRERTK